MHHGSHGHTGSCHMWSHAHTCDVRHAVMVHGHVVGSLREYMGHSRYIWVKKIGRLRGSRTRGCANAAPAAMPPPTEAREGYSGLMGDACARQLDGGVDGRRPPLPSTVTQMFVVGADPEHAACTSLSTADQPIVDERTQWQASQRLCSRQTFASPLRVRWSSAVDSTIELACAAAGLTNKARAALSGLSGRRHGRWCRVRAPSSG